MANWTLPTTADIKGQTYDIYTDYRDILDIINYLNDQEETQETRILISLALFFKDFEQMPVAHYNEAVEYLFSFIDCNEPSNDKPRPKTIDWQQDYNMISAEINRAVGYEVRAIEYMHWFTYIGYFNNIGEGQLSTTVSIREKKRNGKKLDKWELEYYRDNKEKIDLATNYTQQEQAEIDRLNKLLGE